MIVAELALEEERHGEASKEVKMPHQYSGKFFARTENKSQNHQNSNLHHLYIAEIVTKLRAIYDATVWKGIVARFKISDRPFLECTLRDRFSRDPITPQVIYDATLWKDLAAGSKISDRSIHDAITQQPQSIYDATEWRSITPGSKNQTQKSRSIYDAMVWRIISIGDGLAPHQILSMTGRHRSGCLSMTR